MQSDCRTGSNTLIIYSEDSAREGAILLKVIYRRWIVHVRVQEKRLKIKPKQHTQDWEHTRSDRGVVCMSCYPCCCRRVFIIDVGDVASRSESVMRDRKKGHSCPAHREREGGRNGPQLPGICQDWAWVYILSPKQWDNVCYTRGANKKWMFCQWQTMQCHMERSVWQIDKGVTTDVYRSATVGTGLKERLGTMSDGRDTNKG